MKLTFLKNKKKDENDFSKYLLSVDSGFNLTESFNMLRTNIMYSLTKTDKGKIIMVTSATPGDGKSTTTLNMAVSFANIGARVLVIDFDLRKPMISRYSGVNSVTGVTNVLCGYADLGHTIKRNAYNGVDILVAGELPPDPTKIISSDEPKDMLAALATKYDYIFVDTPPVTVVTDAVILSNSCDGVILVAREGVTNIDRLKQTITDLNKTNVNIMGFVVLKPESRGKRYGYYSGGEYGYASAAKNK